MDIVADDIYITVVLIERFELKDKISMVKMENVMFASLKNTSLMQMILH